MTTLHITLLGIGLTVFFGGTGWIINGYLDMGVNNYVGDQIEILFSPMGDGVWTGTVVPASPIYLNYN